MPHLIAVREIDRSFRPCSTNDDDLVHARRRPDEAGILAVVVEQRLRVAREPEEVVPLRRPLDGMAVSVACRRLTWFSGMNVSSLWQYQPACSPR